MTTQYPTAVKALVLALTVCVSQAVVQANLAGPSSPAKGVPAKKASDEVRSGRLIADGPIRVNGNRANTGDTVFSGAQIQTPGGVGATVQMEPLGQLDISPETSLVLNFDQANIHSTVTAGCVRLSTKPGINGSVTIPAGITRRSDPAANAALHICSDGTEITPPEPRPQSPQTGGGQPTGLGIGYRELLTLLAGSGAIIVGANAVDSSGQAAAQDCCKNPSPCDPRN